MTEFTKFQHEYIIPGQYIGTPEELREWRKQDRKALQVLYVTLSPGDDERKGEEVCLVLGVENNEALRVIPLRSLVQDLAEHMSDSEIRKLVKELRRYANEAEKMASPKLVSNQ